MKAASGMHLLLFLSAYALLLLLGPVAASLDPDWERDIKPACSSNDLKNLDADHPFRFLAKFCNDHDDLVKQELEQAQQARRYLASSSPYRTASASSTLDANGLRNNPEVQEDIDDYDDQVVTYHYDYITVGAGVAGCEFTATMLEHPSTSNKKFALIGSGPDVAGKNDTQVSLWKIGSSMPVHNLNSNDKFTRDIPQWQYPEAQALGGASTINPSAMVKPPCDYWNDWNYTSWKCEAMRDIINGVENYKSEDTSGGVNHGHSGHTVITTFPAEIETQKWAQAFHDILPDVPILPNQDSFEIGIADVGRGIDVDGDGNPIRQNIYRKAIYNKTLPNHPDYEPKLDVFDSFRCVKLLFKNNGKVKGVHCIDLRRGRVVRFLLTDPDEGKIILSMDAVRTPPFLERSGIGNRTIIESQDIRVRHENPAVGEGLMADYNTPGFVFGCISGCPKNHTSGHTAMAYYRSPLQKALNSVTGLKTLDCQSGWRYFIENAFSVSVFQNVFQSVGSAHMATADILTDDELVYNKLFDSPLDSMPAAYMVNITRQVVEKLKDYGLVLKELSPTPAVTGTTPEQIAAWVSKNGVPQYHNQGTTPIGKVVDEFQRLIHDPTVMILGGGVIPRNNQLWTHSSHYFALVSGRKGAIDLLTRPDM